MTKSVYRPVELSEFLPLSPASIQRLVAEGKIRTILFGKRPFVRRAEIERLLVEGTGE